MSSSELEIRQQIVEAHASFFQLGFSVGNDGNTSFRINEEQVLITPAGLEKAHLSPQSIALVKLQDGSLIKGDHPPSSEMLMHLETYRQNPECKAVVHTHPPYAIACSLAGISLEERILPEVIIALDQVPCCPYTTPGTQGIANQVAHMFQSHSCLILERHGVVAQGKTLREARTRLEHVEHTAKILLLAHSVQKPTPLPEPEVTKLLQIRARLQKSS